MPLHTLRIYFFGLICHVSESESETTKDFAYLVKTGGHKPVVAYGPAVSQDNTHSFVRIDPDATSVRLNLGDDEARPDLLFRTYVPKLRRILGGKLAPDAADHAIKFQYPRSDMTGAAGRGVLSVSSLYPLKGKFQRPGAGPNTRHDGPVARLTELSIKTEQDTFDVIVTVGGTETTVFPDVSTDGCLLIANIEQEAIDILVPPLASGAVKNDQDPHVQKYEALLTDAGKVTLSQTDAHSDIVTPPACDWIDMLIKHLEGLGVRVSVSVECGNTDYP